MGKVKHLGNPGPISNVHLRIWELGLGGGGGEGTNERNRLGKRM